MLLKHTVKASFKILPIASAAFASQSRVGCKYLTSLMIFTSKGRFFSKKEEITDKDFVIAILTDFTSKVSRFRNSSLALFPMLQLL